MKEKLERFLDNIRYLGDVCKAAGKTRVSRKQLDEWMADHAIAVQIDKAFRDALIASHRGQTARDILFRSKIVPELEKDIEVFRLTGQRHRESKIIAKLAAQDLKGWRWTIIQAANNKDKHFFIDLGRILSGELSGDVQDKLDEDIAEIYAKNPMISTRKALVELARRGHESVEEQTIRTRKTRLGLTKRANCKL